MPRKISVKKPKNIEKETPSNSFLEKLETEIQSNQSKVSLVLGALIILVIGILVFNYFNRSKATLGPAQQTSQQTEQNKYTVKEGDTLFTIAEAQYKNGDSFTEIAKANNLTNPDQIETGQVLEIPNLEAQASVAPSPTDQPQTLGAGGGNNTIWGDKVEGDTYTVIEGDWLSTIAGRAYGDVMAFDKIAKANNISNPDLVEPGTVLTIPR